MAIVESAPIDRLGTKGAVRAHCREDDERLEVDGLPVMTSGRAFDSELGPEAAKKVASEPRDLVGESGNHAAPGEDLRGDPLTRRRRALISERVVFTGYRPVPGIAGAVHHAEHQQPEQGHEHQHGRARARVE
jgi:hypothetical protein